MRWRLLLPLSMLLMPLTVAAQEAATAKSGLFGDVIFTQYATDASSPELARRLVSQLNALRLQQTRCGQYRFGRFAGYRSELRPGVDRQQNYSRARAFFGSD